MCVYICAYISLYISILAKKNYLDLISRFADQEIMAAFRIETDLQMTEL